MFRNIKAISAPGLINNEDALLTGTSYLAVIDGATGLNGAHYSRCATDAQWLSHRTAELLSEYLTTSSDDIWHLMHRTARTVKLELDKMGYAKMKNAYPSASVSVARIVGEYMECYVLGDCPVLVGTKDGLRLVYDDTVAKRDAAVLCTMAEECEKRGISMTEAKEAINPILLKNRMEMNMDGAYWIFEPEGAGIGQGLTVRWKLDEVRDLALLTDGFWAFYSSYALAGTTEEFMGLIRRMPLDNILNEIRCIETSDPDLIKFPRFKVSDDASAIYASFCVD